MGEALNLKRYAALGRSNTFTMRDREDFRTIGFNPDELLQVNEMSHRELTHLMIFCGIRVFNEMPVCILSEDDMRMAYVLWRAQLVNEEKIKLAQKAERGMKWINYLQKVADVISNRHH